MIETELSGAVERPVACLLTHVHVDADDDGVRAADEADRPVLLGGAGAERSSGSAAGSSSRTPAAATGASSPRRVRSRSSSSASIRALLGAGAIAVACGGGGIPVVSRNGYLKGVDAVIDKDRASALLAERLGAERLVILTEVPVRLPPLSQVEPGGRSES